jgi:hypothetical protein
MVPDSLMLRAASSLTAVGIVLVLANWYAKPDAWLAWTAALVMFAVMVAALRASRRALPDSTAKAAAFGYPDGIPTAVVFAALMMGIPLALTLARSYGVVDDVDVGRRSTGVLIGVFLMMLGNVMPKNLPPLSSIGCDAARQQAFLRRAGWTWVLCGLAMAIGWLALPIDAAELASTVLSVTAMAATIVQLLRLRRPHPFTP